MFHLLGLVLIAAPASVIALVMIATILAIWLVCYFMRPRWGRLLAWNVAVTLSLFVALTCAVILIFAAPAYAQSAQDVVDAVCSPDGKQIALYVIGTIGFTGIVTFLEKGIAKLPMPLQHLVNLALGNWRQILVGLGVLKA